MWSWKLTPFKVWLVIPLLALLAVACGSAATATPLPVATAAPAATTVPVAAPTATQIPIAVTVNPGKVTWLVGNFGGERFHYCFGGGAAASYGRQIHDFLIKSQVKDGRLELVPGVASEWGVSADGRTWTVTVREGVKFHDGTELTPEDVLWSFQFSMGEQAKDYALTSGCIAKGGETESFAMDGRKVSVTLKKPDAAFADTISDATGNWFTVNPAYLGTAKWDTVYDEAAALAYDKNPVGAGIFKLVKHEPGVSILMERFDDYFYQPANGLPKDLRPRFAALELRLVPEEAIRVAALRAGEADIAPISLAGKGQVEAGGGRVVFGPEGVYLRGMMLGTWDERFPFSDKRVRHALAYALDLETMANQLYGGPEVFQVKGWDAVTPSTIGYDTDLDPFPFDPDRARALMREAGYRVPGFPEGKDFGKLIINTWVSVATPLMPESAQLAAEFWNRELGIDTEVRVGDEATLKRLHNLTPDLLGQIVWRDNETRLDASTIIFKNYFGARDPSKYDRAGNDPQLWAVSDAAMAVFDPAARPKALHDGYVIMRDSAHWLGVGYFNIPWGVGPRILDWKPKPFASYPSGLDTIVLK